MGKRAVALFFVFCLTLATVVMHLGCVCVGEYHEAAQIKSSKSYELNSERAPIYDCTRAKLTNQETSYYAAIKPTQKALLSIQNAFNEKELLEIHQKLKNYKPVLMKIDSLNIGSDDVSVFEKNERYSDCQLMAHTIGYINSDGDGVTGIEKGFDTLFKNNIIRTDILFPCDAKGRVLSGAKITQRVDNDLGESGIYITADKKVQEIAERCMDEGHIDVGAMVVVEPSTGKIRAMVSRPNFNPNDIGKSLNDKNSPLINRALSAYSVGSVFKPAIAACALEQGLSPKEIYNCNGREKVGEVEFSCYNQNAHAEVDMCAAIEKSCNCYFINLIRKMNIEEAMSTLKAMGFGKEITLCDSLVSKSGVIPTLEELKTPAARANFSFGQGNFLATPLQITSYMSVIANGGILHSPYLIEKAIDKNNVVFEQKASNGKRVLREDTADLIKLYLQSAVENGNGRGARLFNTTSAGKTATAQTGIFKDGKELYNTWFSGFFPVENPRYVVTVIKENGSLGASDCAPVFKMFADEVNKLEK